MKKLINKIIIIIAIFLIINIPTKEIINIKNKNDETNIIATLSIPGTKLNEKITQYTDNEYYLNHDINGKYDPKGTIFMDYRNNIKDKIILIYGHNSRTYKIPFKELENYYDESFYKENNIINLTINNKKKSYEIFSIFIEYKDWSYTKIKFNEDEYLSHLNYLKNKSWYDSNIALSKEDNIIILQTCSYHKDYKKYKNKYLLIIAKEIL